MAEMRSTFVTVRARIDWDEHFSTVRGPLASVRTCRVCGHFEIYRYTGGHRGAGMVGGNKARGRIIQHLKSKHPDLGKRA